MFKPAQLVLVPLAAVTKYPGSTITVVVTFKHIGPIESVYSGVGIAPYDNLNRPGWNNAPILFLSQKVDTTGDLDWKEYTLTLTDVLPSTTPSSGKLDGVAFISNTAPVVGVTKDKDFKLYNWNDDVYILASSASNVELTEEIPYINVPPAAGSAQPKLPIKADGATQLGVLITFKNKGSIATSFKFRFDLREAVSSVVGMTWQEGSWMPSPVVQPGASCTMAVYRDIPAGWDNITMDAQLVVEGVQGEIWTTDGVFYTGTGSEDGGGLFGDIGGIIEMVIMVMVIGMMSSMMKGFGGVGGGESTPAAPPKPVTPKPASAKTTVKQIAPSEQVTPSQPTKIINIY